MHFLLVNNNPAVSRLIVLSVEKLGFNIDEIPSLQDIPRESYDMVFVNNVQYNEEIVDMKKMDGLSRHFIYIGARGESKPSNMDFVIEKPFLPTDFIDLVTKIDTESNENISEHEDFIDDFELPKLKDDIDVFADDEEFFDNALEAPDESKHSVIDLEDDIGIDEEILEESEKENTTQTEDEDENLASVLDRDDINEVKLLLEENSDDDFELCDLEKVENISTLDDLNEKDFLSVFGKEIMIDSVSEKKDFAEEKQESKNIEEEIQWAVSKSVKEALQSSSIKDSLKGMKVNISITFEDEE